MLQLLITYGGVTTDYSRYTDFKSASVRENINVPAVMTFSMTPLDSRFVIPPVMAYVQLFSSVKQKSVFSGFVSSPHVRQYLAKAGPAVADGTYPGDQPAAGFGQLLQYNITCTSDEFLLNSKAIPFIPAFTNRPQGDILTTIADILCPGFFSYQHVASGDLVPHIAYDPKVSWCELAKTLGDGSRYRYKARDKKLWYQPYADAPLGIVYDETQADSGFNPKTLDTTPLMIPLVNDVTIIGDSEAGNNHEDYFLGDGFTGNFPLLHKMFNGASTTLAQESWTNAALNTQQWFLNDPGDNFDFSAGSLNVTTGVTGALYDLGFSYLQFQNGIELAGGLNLQVGEVIFEDFCDGVLGGIYTDDTLTEDTFFAGFVITTPSGVMTSASGAAGVYITPFCGGIPIPVPPIPVPGASGSITPPAPPPAPPPPPPPAPPPSGGSAKIFWMTNPSSDEFTNSPTPDFVTFVNDHVFRVMGFQGYWDSRVAFFPESSFYKDMNGLYHPEDDAYVAAHPSVVYRDGSGNPCFVNFGAQNPDGTYRQYLCSHGNTTFRNKWITDATAAFGAAPYIGVFVDDVDLDLVAVNGSGFVTPIDPATSLPITTSAYQGYLVGHLQNIRTSFPSAEITHNAHFWEAGADPTLNAHLAAQIAASDWVNLEQGFDIVSGTGIYSLQALWEFIDKLHAAGGHFIAQHYDTSNGTYYHLANFFLVYDSGDMLAIETGGYPPGWDAVNYVTLGAATGGRYLWNGLWRRDFDYGMGGTASVFVAEPTGSGGGGALGTTLYNPEGSPVTTISLFAGTGMILFSSPLGIVAPKKSVHKAEARLGAPLVQPVITQVNHSYVLQMVVTAPKYTRYNQTYRTLDGEEFGGGFQMMQGSVTFIIQDFDIAQATGLYYEPNVTTYTVNNVPLPSFGVYGLVNERNFNLSITNTTLAKMPLGGLLAWGGPNGWAQQNIGTFGGTVNTSGTSVTRVTGNEYTKFWAHQTITIAGIAHVIDRFVDADHLILKDSAGVQTGAQYLVTLTQGLTLPLLPVTSGRFVFPYVSEGFIGEVQPWADPASANIYPFPGMINNIPDVLVMGSGFSLQAAQITSGQNADTLAFYAQNLPAAGVPVRLQSWETQAAVSRLQVKASIDQQKYVVGDDGIRSAIVTDLKPLPRTSEDCDSAAQAFLDDRTNVAYNGTYVCTSLFFNGLDSDEQYWPTVGRFLHVHAPRRGINFQRMLVSQLNITVLDAVTELLQYEFSFGADLHLEKVLKNFVDLAPDGVLTPVDTATPPNPRFTQNVDNSFLPDLDNVSIDINSFYNETATVDVYSDWRGAIEVRHQDTGWGRSQVEFVTEEDLIAAATNGGFPPVQHLTVDQWNFFYSDLTGQPVPLPSQLFPSDPPTTTYTVTQYLDEMVLHGFNIHNLGDRNLIGVFYGPVFTLPRLQYDTIYYLRPVYRMFPDTVTSRRSKALRVRWPLQPFTPLLVGVNGLVVQFNFNGDQRNIYGFELRWVTDGVPVPIVQKPVASYADMLIDLTQTVLGIAPGNGLPSWELQAFFFSAGWLYSKPLEITVVNRANPTSYTRTFLAKDTTVGNNIADVVTVQASGKGVRITGVLRDAISADLTVRCNMGKTLTTVDLVAAASQSGFPPVQHLTVVQWNSVVATITGNAGPAPAVLFPSDPPTTTYDVATYLTALTGAGFNQPLPLITITIPAATPIGTVITSTAFTHAPQPLVDGDVLVWDILASGGETDVDGVASFTLMWN